MFHSSQLRKGNLYVYSQDDEVMIDISFVTKHCTLHFNEYYKPIIVSVNKYINKQVNKNLHIPPIKTLVSPE